MNTLIKARGLEKIIVSSSGKEGAGFQIRRPFPTSRLDSIDPFLLLDHLEPVTLAPGQAKGAPDHPHRGFETVTYLLSGSMIHRDSAGNSGVLKAGDVQWMTAGAGVVHSEMPSPELLSEGGVLHGFQLWVNLPRRDKMIKPRYQDIAAESLPVVSTEDGAVKIKIIAGEALGQSAVIDTRTAITYLHLWLSPGAEHVQPMPEEFNSFLYVIEGEALFGEKSVGVDELALFEKGGDHVRLRAGGEGFSALLVGGKPLGEPVVRYGPFVMNEEWEIEQAFRDFRDGKLGVIS